MFVNTYVPEGMRYKTKENKTALSCPEALERAAEQKQILEAPVLLCDNRLRLHVDLGCMVGIIRREDAVYCRPGEAVKDIAVITRVGKPVCFHVIGFGEENGRRVAYLSRKTAQEECAERHLFCLRPGDVLPAKVTHLENYGAFVDVGCGIASLLSIDCISVSRITHPRERLACGMQISVVIKSVGSFRQQRFQLTVKQPAFAQKALPLVIAAVFGKKFSHFLQRSAAGIHIHCAGFGYMQIYDLIAGFKNRFAAAVSQI